MNKTLFAIISLLIFFGSLVLLAIGAATFNGHTLQAEEPHIPDPAESMTLEEQQAMLEAQGEFPLSPLESAEDVYNSILDDSASTSADMPVVNVESFLPPRAHSPNEVAVVVGTNGAYSVVSGSAGLELVHLGPQSDGVIFPVGETVGGDLYAGDGSIYHLMVGSDTWDEIYTPDIEGGYGAAFDVFLNNNNGDLYLATTHGIKKQVGGEWESLTNAEFTWSGTMTPDGVIYASGTYEGDNGNSVGAVWRVDNGQLVEIGTFPDDEVIRQVMVVGESLYARGHYATWTSQIGNLGNWSPLTYGFAHAMVNDDRGRLFLGDGDGTIKVFGDGNTLLDESAFFDEGKTISALYVTGDKILIGTGTGVYEAEIDTNGGVIANDPAVSKFRMARIATQNIDISDALCPGLSSWIYANGGSPGIIGWGGSSNVAYEVKFVADRYNAANTSVSGVEMVSWECYGSNPVHAAYNSSNSSTITPGNRSCNHDYYAIATSKTGGYTIVQGKVLKDDRSWNGNKYSGTVEIYPVEFGDLAAESESDFPVSGFYRRQRAAHDQAQYLFKSGNTSFETTPAMHDTGDDSLQVLYEGSWSNPESVTLFKGFTYQFRVNVPAVSVPGQAGTAGQYLRVWADWDGANGNPDQISRLDGTGGTPQSGMVTFDVTIPSTAVDAPWFRVSLTKENVTSVDQFIVSLPYVTVITGEIEDYRIATTTPNADISLNIIETIDPLTINDPTEQITYLFQITNVGDRDIAQTQLIIGDTAVGPKIPNEITQTSLTFTGSSSLPGNALNMSCDPTFIGRTARCVINTTLPPGSNALIEMTGTIREGNVRVGIVDMVLTSSAWPQGMSDANPADNWDTETTRLIKEIDVRVDKRDLEDPVATEGVVEWELEVVNNSNLTAHNLTVGDLLPSEATNVTIRGDGLSCTRQNRDIVCVLARFTARDTRIIQISANAPDFETTLTNSVDVSIDETDPNLSNNSDTEDTLVKESRITGVKADRIDPVMAGADVTWDISVTNIGDVVAQDVVVRDPIPGGLTPTSFTSSQGTCSLASNIVTCFFGDLDPGDTAEAEIVVWVPATYTQNTVINNAGVFKGGALSLNIEEDTTIIKQADLSIDKRDSEDPVRRGDSYVYSIDVTNNGPAVTDNFTISDQLPMGLIFDGLSENGWNCTYTALSRELECLYPTNLAVGETSPAVEIFVTVPDSWPEETYIYNTATVEVSSNFVDPVSSNNTDTEETFVERINDWVILPASGYVFAHVEFSDQLQEDREFKGDFYDQVIRNPLQVPFDIGLAFHESSSPSLCLVNETPCPPEFTIYGITLVEGYTIDNFGIPSSTSSLNISFSGDMNRPMNRYAEATTAQCIGRCVGYGLYNATNYEWLPSELIRVATYPIGSRSSDVVCPEDEQCIIVQEGAPGRYQLDGRVFVRIIFPGIAYEPTYTLPARATIELTAPYVQPRGQSTSSEEGE